MFTSSIKRKKKNGKDVLNSFQKKKKSSRQRRSTTYDSDSNDDGDIEMDVDGDGDGDGNVDRAMNRKRRKDKKSKKKKKRTSGGNAMSFALHEEDDEEDYQGGGGGGDGGEDGNKKQKKDKKKKKRKKKSSGLGFGGHYLNDEEDDNDDNDTEAEAEAGVGVGVDNKAVGLGAGMKRKTFGMGSLSINSIIHDDDDNDNENDDPRMMEMREETTEEQKATETTTSAAATSSSSSLYGKEAMEKLKAQQKSYTHPTPENNDNNNIEKDEKNENDKNENGNHPTNIPLPPRPSSNAIPKPPLSRPFNNDEEEDDDDDDDGYIPLDSSTSSRSNRRNIIITGDEALMYTGELEEDDIHFYKADAIANANGKSNATSNNQKKKQTTSDLLMGINESKDHDHGNNDDDDDNNNDDNDMEVDEGNRKWEEEIARRVGLSSGSSKGSTKPTTTTTTTATTNKHQPTSNDRNMSSSPTTNKSNSTKIISNMKHTIQTTIHNLTEMEEDIQSNKNRRTNEYNLSKNDTTTKQNELQQIGINFEYYQKLRLSIVNWISALRYVNKRTTTVQMMMNQLYVSCMTQKEKYWKYWEDDVIAMLIECDCLDYVVGRQPDVIRNKKNKDSQMMGNKDEEILVDEFGRDIRSLESLARIKRHENRCRTRAESKDRRRDMMNNDIDSDTSSSSSTSKKNPSIEAIEYEDSDLDIDDNELMDRDERRNNLSDAMSHVLNEMEEEYSTPHKLISIFVEWQAHCKTDYDQCYARLALVELMNVFVKAECCQKLDLLCFLNGKEATTTTSNSSTTISLKDFSWFTALEESTKISTSMTSKKDVNEYDTSNGREDDVVHKKIDEKNQSLCSDIKNEIVAKELSTYFHSMVKCPCEEDIGLYDPFSTKQTKSMIDFYKLILCNQDSSTSRKNIENSVVLHINNFIQNLAFPVVNQNISKVLEEDDKDNTIDYLIFSTFGQLRRLRKLVCNLTKWYSTLVGEAQSKLAKLCLMDVIAYRFLPILDISEKVSIIRGHEGEGVALFQDVLKYVKDVGWLENNSKLIFSSAPLRAVAKKYNL